MHKLFQLIVLLGHCILPLNCPMHIPSVGICPMASEEQKYAEELTRKELPISILASRKKREEEILR